MSEALSYALATLGCGVRNVLGEQLAEAGQPVSREELVKDLVATFRGAEELKNAIGDAYTRALQSLVIGLKQAWLLMETGGEVDYCEAFGELRQRFVEDEGIDPPLLLSFLDGFFIDYDTALDAAEAVLQIDELSDEDFLGALLGAGEGDAAEQAARATAAIRAALTGEGVGLEEEHPIVRLGCWSDLLADGLHFHFSELCRRHPSWSRYLEGFKPNTLDREEGRAIAKQDDAALERLRRVRGLIERREEYRRNFGEIIPNLEWLFDIADRLEEVEENVESDLLKGRAIAATDLPKIVAVGVSKVHTALNTKPVGQLSDVLTELTPGVRDVLRRARRDFRRCHWSGGDYGEAALQLAGAMLPVAGPGAAERYYREAGAFGGDRGTVEFSLFLTEMLSGDFEAALKHLLQAAEAAPDRFQIFDFQRYQPQAILGAGGSGPTFLVETDGERAVVKSLWDPVSSVDPRPALKPLALLHKQGVPGLAQLLHLGVNLKEFPYVTSAFVEGDDFDSVLEARGGKVPHMQVCMLGGLAARRLQGIHEAGSVHRNLKPHNLIMGVGEEGLEVTLLDPCIPNVMLAAPGRVANIRRLMAWSCTGRVIAEDFAAYTAPEVVRGGLEAATPLSDIYSLGGVLYRLATGLAPRQPNIAALPSPLRPVLERCLSPRPEQRPATAEELADLLDRAADEPEEETPPPPVARASSTAVAPPPPPPPAASGGFDPFAGGLPGMGGGAALAPDPFAPPPAGHDPFGAPAGHDPFAGGLPGDPFAGHGAAGAGVADPFAAPGAFPGGGDPFAGAGAGVADPFAAPGAFPGGDPFAAPGAFPGGGDPFAGHGGGDPFAGHGGGGAPAFAPPGGDPFAAPFPGGGDPFAAPFPGGGDPFAAPFPGGAGDPFADPLAALVPADPFAAIGMAEDPFASHDPFPEYGGQGYGGAGAAVEEEEDEDELEAMDPGEALAMLESMMGPSTKKKPAPQKQAPPQQQRRADPYGTVAPQSFGAPGDPFAAMGGGGDPFAGGGGDPFAMGGGDPYAMGGDDPFAAMGGGDPFAAAGAGDPFAAMGGGDPFAAMGGGDPFAAAAGGDPFAAAAGGDPFAAAAGGDPFAAAAGGDPFAAAAGGDPFAAAAGGDPFAAAAGGDPFAAAAGHDPFSAPPGAETSAGGLWLSADEAPAPQPPPKKAAAPAAAKPKKKKGGGEAASYGVVISGLGLKSKKDAAVKVVMQIKSCSEGEAQDLCRASVVPVLKAVGKEEAEEAEALFKAAGITCRVTSKKRRH
ncbi:MAG: hypothetical protein AB7N76_21680 [Planctomycetota bacterium]